VAPLDEPAADLLDVVLDAAIGSGEAPLADHRDPQ
jgi:hypothetical protein